MNKLKCVYCGHIYIVSKIKKDAKFYVCPMCEKQLKQFKSEYNMNK